MLKKIIILVLCLFGFMSAYGVLVGGGTLNNPYNISSCVNLNETRDNLNSVYQLTTDFDCSDTVNWNGGVGFEPIGTETNQFIGNFNGNDYTISNLFINRSSKLVGMFEYINNSNIYNLNLYNFSIYNYGGYDLFDNNYTGVLVGIIYNSNISNISVSDSIIKGTGGFYSGTGGIIGATYNSILISNRFIGGEVFGPSHVGGIAGFVRSTIFNKSYVKSNIKGNIQVGGIAGDSYDNSIIDNSYVESNISYINTSRGFFMGHFGGIVGMNGGATITNSISKSNITGNRAVGGLVGGGTIGIISNGYFEGYLTSDNTNIGGIYGGNNLGNINNIFVNIKNTPTVAGSDLFFHGQSGTSSHLF